MGRVEVEGPHEDQEDHSSDPTVHSQYQGSVHGQPRPNHVVADEEGHLPPLGAAWGHLEGVPPL